MIETRNDQPTTQPRTAEVDPGQQRRNPARWVADLLVHQGDAGNITTPIIAAWRPVAAGGVIALGGIVAIVAGLVGWELVDILLIAGITLFIAGLLDGTGRRFRGPGTGFLIIAISTKFVFDPVPSLREGWPYGAFLLVWGVWVIYRSSTSQERIS
jgi:hypothetical protein